MCFKNLKIGARLTIGFAAFMLIIILIMAVNINATRKVENLSNRIIKLRMPAATSSTKLNTGINYATAALRGWILLGEEKFKKERIEAWEQYIKPSLSQMRELSYKWDNHKNAWRLKKVEKLLKELEHFQQEIEEIVMTPENIQAKETDNWNRVNYLLKTQTVPMGKELSLLLEEMVDNQQALLRDDEEKIKNLILFLSRLEWLLSIVGVLLAAGFVFYIARSVTIPISGLVELAQKIAKGDFRPELTIISSTATEVDRLRLVMEKMGRNLYDYRESTIKDGEIQLSSFLDNVVDGIIIINDYGIIESFNPAAERIFGYKAGEIVGLNVKTLMPEPDHSKHDGYLRHYRETGEAKILGVSSLELSGRRKDGSLFPISLLVTEMQLTEKRTFVGSVRDITARKELDEAIRLNNEEMALILEDSEELRDESDRAREEANKSRQIAEAASNAKSEFLASMSHEIRTPMNAIIGMGDLLDETDLTDEQKKYVNTFRYAGENLLEIINDILDLSKIEAGRMELERELFDFEELIEMTSDIMLFRAMEKGLDLNVFLAEDLPIGLIGDVTRLRQVIINLLGNAIKFTEQGDISISVKLEQMDKDEAELVFSVKDTGIGIPSEKLEHIFENFSQVDSSTTRKYGGTGLGLAICKRIVALMGGRIWIRSKEGEGSTFYFTAIFGIKKDFKKRVRRDEADLNGLRVLIADDTTANRMILRNMLTLWGAKTAEIKDGATCLAEIRKAKESGDPYKLLLLDYKMPDINGFEVAREIKEDEGLNLPVILLTSSSIQVNSAAKEPGISRCLSKPVKRFDLRRAITFSLRKMRKDKFQSSDKTEAEAPDRSLKILLVDDNKENRNLIRMYLKKTSHTIDMAENGQIAVEKVTDNNSS